MTKQQDHVLLRPLQGGLHLSHLILVIFEAHLTLRLCLQDGAPLSGGQCSSKNHQQVSGTQKTIYQTPCCASLLPTFIIYYRKMNKIIFLNSTPLKLPLPSWCPTCFLRLVISTQSLWKAGFSSLTSILITLRSLFFLLAVAWSSWHKNRENAGMKGNTGTAKPRVTHPRPLSFT